MMLTVAFTRPPNFEAICAAFPVVRSRRGVVFTYAPNLYNPSRIEITHDLWAHESVHGRQQGKDPEGWWEKYLADRDFRIAQEVEAYRAQIATGREVYGRKELRKLVDHCAKTLAGPLYGSTMSPAEARILLLEENDSVKGKA